MTPIAICLRTFKNQYTLEACLDSIYTYLSPSHVFVCYNAEEVFADRLKAKFPLASFSRYPYKVTPPSRAVQLPTEDPTGLWNFTKWSFDKAFAACPRVLKVDGDQVLTAEGSKAFLEQYADASYMGIACLELTSPSTYTKEFTGEEPRYFDLSKYPAICCNRIPGTGYEYIGDLNNLYNRGGRSHCWGPCLTLLKGPAMFLHYGFLNSVDPARPMRNLEQVHYSGTHHCKVDLAKVFAK